VLQNHPKSIGQKSKATPATLSSVKFGETCNFEVKCLLSVLFSGHVQVKIIKINK
jgi:hypothetical protein